MKKQTYKDCTIISYEDEVKDDITKALRNALIQVGLAVERNAKEEISIPKAHADGSVRPNVKTGTLRKRITHSYNLANLEVNVGTNVKYAKYVEMGTSRSRPYPFLTPAVKNHMQEYQTIVKEELSVLK